MCLCVCVFFLHSSLSYTAVSGNAEVAPGGPKRARHQLQKVPPVRLLTGYAVCLQGPFTGLSREELER